MAGLMVVVKGTATGKEARDEIVAELSKVATAVRENEQGATRFAVCVPLDDADQTTFYVIQGFESQAALQAHISQPYEQACRTWIRGSQLCAAPPKTTITTLTSSFARPGLSTAGSAFICALTLTYKPDKRALAVPGWAAVVAHTEEHELGALSYWNGIVDGTETEMETVEIYESQDYFRSVHIKSEAVQENVKAQQGLREGFTHTFLKMVDGFLGR